MADQSSPSIFPVSVVEKPFQFPIKDPAGSGAGAVGVPLAALPEGWRLESLKFFLDEYRHKPARRVGQQQLDDISFPDYVNRYKNDDTTVIFVTRRFWRSRVTAVFDYHPSGADQEQAGNAAFRAVTTLNSALVNDMLKKIPGVKVFYGSVPSWE